MRGCLVLGLKYKCREWEEEKMRESLSCASGGRMGSVESVECREEKRLVVELFPS